MAPNEWVLVTPASIKTPPDLNGKRIGIHGPATLTEQLVKATIKKYALKSDVLVVPGSDARIQALISKQLDATPTELADFLELRQSKPRDYHAVIDYSKEYPFLTGSAHHEKNFANSSRRCYRHLCPVMWKSPTPSAEPGAMKAAPEEGRAKLSA
jgi:ABC-type amino acid transport substrate-binding protein